MSTRELRIKRVYDPPEKSDGARVLVDRVWPRGVRKDKAALDAWLREVAPSSSLRQWFAHDPERFGEFRKRYRKELADEGEALDEIRRLLKEGPVTLVYGARDTHFNQAVVLQEFLRERKAPRATRKKRIVDDRPARAGARSPSRGRDRALRARSGSTATSRETRRTPA